MTLPPVFSTLTPSLANGLSMVASFPLNVIVTISPTGMLYSPKVTLSMEETGKVFRMPPALLLKITEAGLVMKLMPPILLTGVSYKTLPLGLKVADGDVFLYWIGVEERPVSLGFIRARKIDKLDFTDVINANPMGQTLSGDNQGFLSFEGELIAFGEDIKLFFAIVQGDEGADFNALGMGGEKPQQRPCRQKKQSFQKHIVCNLKIEATKITRFFERAG